jgi:hypothetical protein
LPAHQSRSSRFDPRRVNVISDDERNLESQCFVLLLHVESDLLSRVRLESVWPVASVKIVAVLP